MKWVCCRSKEQESISDDHLRASGPWLVRAADPLRSTPPAPGKDLARPSATAGGAEARSSSVIYSMTRYGWKWLPRVLVARATAESTVSTL